VFWSKKADKDALDAALRAVGKAATALIVEKVAPDHVFPPTATHFGSAPYFESGEAWPAAADGRPCDFVCQVNLDECPVRPEVPFDLFTVFFAWSLYEEGEVEETCVVRTYRGAAAEKAVVLPRPPARAGGDYKVRPCRVSLETFMTYPWTMPRDPALMAAASKFGDPETAYSESLKRLGAWHDDRSRVGGYATWVHDNTLEDDDMVLLAQIAYEPSANNCIGDAAPIFIGVSRSDPTHIEVDATQTH
jgi:hypothetical protein